MDDNVVYCGNLSTTVQLTDRVYLRMGDLPVRDQCNVGIVETARGIVLVDYPRQDPDEEIIREAEALLGKPVTHIFFTHAHGDHRDGLAAFHQREIRLLGSARCMEEIARLYPALVPQMQVVKPGQPITIDDLSFDFWQPALVPAHSPWDMTILLRGEDLAFTGDFLVPPYYLYFHASDWQNWQRGLLAFAQDVEQAVLAMGHGAAEQRATACANTLEYMQWITALWQACGQKPDIRHPLYRKACERTNRETVLRQLREIDLRAHGSSS